MLLPSPSGGYIALGPRDEIFVAQAFEGAWFVWLSSHTDERQRTRLSGPFDTRQEAEAVMHGLVARAGSPSPVTFHESADTIFVALVGARFTRGSIDRLKEVFEPLGGKKIVILEAEPLPDLFR